RLSEGRRRGEARNSKYAWALESTAEARRLGLPRHRYGIRNTQDPILARSRQRVPRDPAHRTAHGRLSQIRGYRVAARAHTVDMSLEIAEARVPNHIDLRMSPLPIDDSSVFSEVIPVGPERVTPHAPAQFIFHQDIHRRVDPEHEGPGRLLGLRR